MRKAFDAWAQREGQIVRRREDKPEEYLVSETQRRWVIWQAALSHAAVSADTPVNASALREHVLDEVLAACAQLDRSASIDDVKKLIVRLKGARSDNLKEASNHAL